MAHKQLFQTYDDCRSVTLKNFVPRDYFTICIELLRSQTTNFNFSGTCCVFDCHLLQVFHVIRSMSIALPFFIDYSRAELHTECGYYARVIMRELPVPLHAGFRM